MRINKSTLTPEYRMPDGKTWTKNAVKMARAWARIYKPICKKFGLGIIGFDPNILFTYGDLTFDLPTDIAIKIRDLIKEKK